LHEIRAFDFIQANLNDLQMGGINDADSPTPISDVSMKDDAPTPADEGSTDLLAFLTKQQHSHAILGTLPMSCQPAVHPNLPEEPSSSISHAAIHHLHQKLMRLLSMARSTAKSIITRSITLCLQNWILG